MRILRRTLAVALLVLVLAVAGPPAVVGAQEPSDPPVPTTLRRLPEDAGEIVKHPNYGQPPRHPGERGGWQQTLVLLLILGGIGGGVALVVRDARRRREAPVERSASSRT